MGEPQQEWAENEFEARTGTTGTRLRLTLMIGTTSVGLGKTGRLAAGH